MLSKKKWFVGILIGLLLVVSSAGMVYASGLNQDDDPPAPGQGQAPPEGERPEGERPGCDPLDESVREAMAEAMIQALANAAGLSVEEIEASLEAGEKPHEIAAANGLDDETFKTVMEEALANFVEQALADGLITEEQAEMILSHGPGGHGGGKKGGRRPGGERPERLGDQALMAPEA